MAGYYRLKEFGFRLSSGAHILTRDMVEPVAAATELLDEARRQAAAIVLEAEAALAAERIRGFEEGLQLARIEAAERLLAENQELDRRLAGLEAGLSEIVVASVRRLVHSFDDRDHAVSLVRAGLKQMRREKRAELRVSPEQYAFLRGAVDGIVADFPEVEMVDVVEDASLVAPQITLETAIGRIEGDLGRNLAELELRLRAAAAHPPEAPAVSAAEPGVAA